MKNNYKIFLCLLVFIVPRFIFGLDRRLEKKRYGKYSVVISQSFESGFGSLVIKQGAIKVFQFKEIDDHYYFGNHFDKDETEKDFYSGRDITGKGIPNLVISNWTGGAHCCHFLYIFELGKSFKKLITVEANSSFIELIDLDHDGFPEIEFFDGAIDYLFSSFAQSPGGRVVLKFKNDHYEVDSNLMKKHSLNQKNIKKLILNCKLAFKKEDSPELPYLFLKTMMDLSYSGQYELAMKIASEAWPSDKSGLELFKNDFKQALLDSHYWKKF